MNSAAFIQRFSKNVTRVLLALGFLKGLIRALPFLFVAFMTLSVLDIKVEIPIWGLRLLWLWAVLGAGVLFASGFFPVSMFSIREKAKNLQQRTPDMRSDELRVAVELAVQEGGVSQELREVFLQRMAEKISSCRPTWCFPSWNWWVPLVSAVLVIVIGTSLLAFCPATFAFSPNVWFPFSSRTLERSIKIEPGNAEVPLGHDVVLTLTMVEKSIKDPVLQIKTAERWIPFEPDSSGLGKYSYTVKKVTTPMLYRVLWKKESSRHFTLVPVEPVQFTKFSMKIHPPDYIGKESAVQTSPEIAGLAGSRVELEAQANAPLEQANFLFSDGREHNSIKIDGTKAHFVFSIDKNGTYSFSLIPRKSPPVKQEAMYPIHVTQDQPPSIILLSPDQDVVVGQKEKLPLTFDVRDDFGLGDVFLVWESKRGGTNRERIKRFEGVVENSIATHEWDLTVPSFQPGEAVRYQLEVWDKNTLTGPGKAVSDWRVLEIKSFEQDHAVIEKALEAWRNKALEVLAQVSSLKSKVEAENADMSSLNTAFNQPAQNMRMLDESLKQIVSKMENDPLADYGVWLEHKEMEGNLSALNNGAVKEAQAAFQTQNKSAAAARMDEITNELEKMSTLSEDLSKAQKARDVMDAGEKLEDLGDDLMKTLESASPGSALEKIKDLLAEAQKNLMEMAQSIQQMPGELPDDFVNQEALKNLEIGKSQDILSQISDAVKRGDMKQAMALAQKFSEMAKSMRKQISKAHESFLESNSAETLGKEIGEQQEALERLIDQERQVLAETQKLASKRMEAVMRAQQDLLTQLAVRQEKVVQAAKPQSNMPVRSMEDVAAELRSKHLEHSVDWLGAITFQVKAIEMDLVRSSSTAAVVGRVQQIYAEEAAILNVIKNPPQPKQDLSAEERERHSNLQKRQQEIRKDTQGVNQKLQVLSRKTASLGVSLMKSFAQAGNEMNDAAESLGKEDSSSAQHSEENALDSLLEGQSALSQAQSAMSDMAMEQGGESGEGGGSGKGGPKVILKNAPGGGRGHQTGKVKLPTAEDYRPPKAFREDLLESLKENYPQIYEEIIHKYYKRLAE